MSVKTAGFWHYAMLLLVMPVWCGLEEPSEFLKNISENDPQVWLEYSRRNHDQRLGAMAACTWASEQFASGFQLDHIGSKIESAGYDVLLAEPYGNALALNFMDFDFRLVLDRSQFNGGISQPRIDIFSDRNQWVPLEFSAYIMICTSDTRETVIPGFHFIMENEFIQEKVMDALPALTAVSRDFSLVMGHITIERALGKLMTEATHLPTKLPVYVYHYQNDVYPFSSVQMPDAHYSRGAVYFNAEALGEPNQILAVLLHELSHLFFAGGHYNPSSIDNRWLDEGFAQWVVFSYLDAGGLLPPDMYQKRVIRRHIDEIRSAARAVFQLYSAGSLTLSNISSGWLETGSILEDHLYILAESMVAWMVESFSIEDVIEVIREISASGHQLTETILMRHLDLDYRTVEEHWQDWVQTGH